MPPLDQPRDHAVPRWRRRAGRLAEDLAAAGYLTDPRWRTAVAAVPRHRLLHTVGDPGASFEDDLTDDELAAFYAVEQTGPDAAGVGDPTPAAVAWLLDLLTGAASARPLAPLRTLQVGAGGPYMTGLLCAGLGDRHTVAVETDPGRAATVAAVLREQGWYPEILTAPQLCPGGSGRVITEYGPYDAILLDSRHTLGSAFLAICIGQLAPRGRMVLCPLARDVGPGVVEVLDRGADGTVTARPIIGDVRGPLTGPRPASEPFTGAEQAGVEFLVAHPELCAEIRARHVVDPAGHCSACSLHDEPDGGDGDGLRGGRQVAPCPVRILADLAHLRRPLVDPSLPRPRSAL